MTFYLHSAYVDLRWLRAIVFLQSTNAWYDLRTILISFLYLCCVYLQMPYFYVLYYSICFRAGSYIWLDFVTPLTWFCYIFLFRTKHNDSSRLYESPGRKPGWRFTARCKFVLPEVHIWLLENSTPKSNSLCARGKVASNVRWTQIWVSNRNIEFARPPPNQIQNCVRNTAHFLRSDACVTAKIAGKKSMGLGQSKASRLLTTCLHAAQSRI